MSRAFDPLAAERWLQARPPTTLLGLADRLLIASVADRAEGAEFVARFADDVVAAAQSLEAIHHLTTLCVLCATFEEFSVDVDRLERLRTGIAMFQSGVGFPNDEPWRSTARYWLWRAGLAKDFSLDRDPPTGPWVAFAYYSHVVLFDGGYGRAAVAAPRFFDDAVRTVDVDDADSVALLLLCGCCKTDPPDLARFWQRLGELQTDDGGFVTRVDSDAARHHAACVAMLAWDLRCGRRRP